MTRDRIRIQESLGIIKRMNELQAEMEGLDDKRTHLYAEYHRLWVKLELNREGAKTRD